MKFFKDLKEECDPIYNFVILERLQREREKERERRKGENEFLRKYIRMLEVWMERVQVVGHELSGKLWGE